MEKKSNFLETTNKNRWMRLGEMLPGSRNSRNAVPIFPLPGSNTPAKVLRPSFSVFTIRLKVLEELACVGFFALARVHLFVNIVFDITAWQHSLLID